MSTRYESADEFSLVEEPFIPGGYPLLSASALPHHSSSLKSLLPRLWDILSSPSRSPPRPDPQSWYQNQSHSSLFSRNGSPSFSKKQKHRKVPSDLNFSTKSTKSKPKKSEETQTLDPENENEIDYTTLPPLDGEEGELIDDEACYFVGFGYSKFTNEEVQDGVKDKEKESRVPTLDILANLPQELAIHILTLLSPPLPLSTAASLSLPAIQAQAQAQIPQTSLQTILTCRLVSRSWCRLASDNQVWRALFCDRWPVDLRRGERFGFAFRSAGAGAGTSDEDGGRGNNIDGYEAVDEFLVHRQQPMKRVVPAMQLGLTWFEGFGIDKDDDNRAATTLVGDEEGSGSKSKSTLPSKPSIPIPLSTSPLLLDWRLLYRERMELERRWEGGTCVTLSEFDAGGDRDGMENIEVKRERYEPVPMRITGHSDSVYCLEFDSRRIITGSRDKKIKVWSLKTGRLLGTFAGQHSGSVLCLKFEKDWERGWGGAEALAAEGKTEEEEYDDDDDDGIKPGFMVSGSSDCTVCVWDLYLGRVVGSAAEEAEGEVSSASSSSSTIGGRRRARWRRRADNENGDEHCEREVNAQVRATLRGHSQGVLDLRIDSRWIVSCSKDAVIRVWDRKTLELYRVLRGHEGPVNAVGLQNGRVVSASGDGKLILWDIESGERLRTFEGHNRGLACIEYKGDLIVSGSNDCKIKIWSASTGECLRDLTGHEALVRALSFDPLSGRLVSASYDRSIKVWDLATGRMVREFKGVDVHTSHIFDVKFDVGRIVSTSHDQKIVVHDFSVGLNTSLFV